uniref:2'-5' RNA ligase family protein n=1 Tax=candidate division WOR-3 bacterium TaxID=2052148 RepID=A0A7C4CDG6_UNCW3
MKPAQYMVVVLPKLDAEAELLRLRDRYGGQPDAIPPYVQLTGVFTPSDLSEAASVNEYVSKARRRLHAIAASFHSCFELGDKLLLKADQGAGELTALQREVAGPEPTSFLAVEELPRSDLVLGRFPDPMARTQVAAQVNRMGRVLGVIDALVILRIGPEDDWHITAQYPFGIGRVDYFERFLT